MLRYFGKEFAFDNLYRWFPVVIEEFFVALRGFVPGVATITNR